jgi:Gluconate 2-dehydrogenase subunit 3
MNRRSIIKNLGVSILATTALPAWAINWKRNDFAITNFAENQLLEKLVDAIIPKTDTPGAKEIGAHLFVNRMLNDCHTEATQVNFKKMLSNLKTASETTFGKAIESISPVEVLSLIKNSPDISTIALLKSLTIQAYTNSEYYLTKHKNYQMAPGYFHGCVDAS